MIPVHELRKYDIFLELEPSELDSLALNTHIERDRVLGYTLKLVKYFTRQKKIRKVGPKML